MQIFKNDKRDKTETIAAPVRREVNKRSAEFLFFAIFTIAKKARTEKRNGTKEIKASALLTAKKDDKRTERVNKTIGRSKGVLLNITWPLAKDFIPNTNRIIITTMPNNICLGSTNASVVKVKRKNGKIRRRSPKRNRDAFSK